jgi:hypothetical protein
MRRQGATRHARLLKIEPGEKKWGSNPHFGTILGILWLSEKGTLPRTQHWPLFKTFALWRVSPSRHTHRREKHQTGKIAGFWRLGLSRMARLFSHEAGLYTP